MHIFNVVPEFFSYDDAYPFEYSSCLFASGEEPSVICSYFPRCFTFVRLLYHEYIYVVLIHVSFYVLPFAAGVYPSYVESCDFRFSFKSICGNRPGCGSWAEAASEPFRFVFRVRRLDMLRLMLLFCCLRAIASVLLNPLFVFLRLAPSTCWPRGFEDVRLRREG